MKNKIIFYFIILLLLIKIKNIQIHPLNEFNQACILDIDKSLDYYFYTSLTNVKVKEHISYLISNEITKSTISYIFLEKDNYEDITDSNINNYAFNETLGFMDKEKFF